MKLQIRCNEGTTLELSDKMRPDSSKLEEQYRCIIAYELAANRHYKAARSVLMTKGIRGLSPLSLDILSRILIQTRAFKDAFECLQRAAIKSDNRQKYEFLSTELHNYYIKRLGKLLILAKAALLILWIILSGILINSYFFKSNVKQDPVMSKEIFPFYKTYHIDSGSIIK